MRYLIATAAALALCPGAEAGDKRRVDAAVAMAWTNPAPVAPAEAEQIEGVHYDLVQQCDGNKCRWVKVPRQQPSGVIPAAYAAPVYTPPHSAQVGCASGTCGEVSGYSYEPTGWYPGKLLGRRR